jgi:hypothetical protein
VQANEHVRRAYLGEEDAPLHEETRSSSLMMDVRTEIVHVAGSTCGWHMTSSASAEVALHDTRRACSRATPASPDLIAQREKEFGIWTTYTWRSVEDHVRRMSIGLAGLGVAPATSSC